MTIYKKALFVTVLPFLVLLIIVSYIASALIKSNLNNLEQTAVKNDVHTVEHILKGELEDLQRVTRDYALWDDAYDYIHTRNEEHISSNYTIDGTSSNKTNIIVYLDNNNDIVRALMFDNRNRKILQPPQSLLNDIANTPAYTNHKDATDKVAGFIPAPREFFTDTYKELLENSDPYPLLFAAYPITTTDSKSPIAGTLIMMRVITPKDILAIQTENNIDFEMYDLNSKHLLDKSIRYNGDIETLHSMTNKLIEEKSSSKKDLLYTDDKDEKTLTSYKVLYDVKDTPIRLLEVNTARTFFKESRRNLVYTIAIILIPGFILLFLVILFLDTIILANIRTFITFIQRLAKNEDLSERIIINTDDEFGLMAKTFNTMLNQVENLQKQMYIINSQLKNEIDEVQKFKLAVEGAHEHIVITDKDGYIIFANKAAEKTTGYSIHEMKGQTPKLWGGQMPKDFYINMWTTIKLNKQSFEGEVINKRKDGSRYTAEVLISPVIGSTNEADFFIGIERDVTKAKEVDRMKSEFVSLASHQLKTPLAAIKWFSEMLLAGDAGKLTTEQEEYIKDIGCSNERMIDLVNTLLNISKMETGKLVFEKKPINMHKILNEIIKEFQNKLQSKNQKLTLSISDNLPLINTDERLIHQVYTNLISNAIKYTPKDGVITIALSKENNNLISKITDTGYGIPTKDQEHIFDKFYRGANANRIETEGSGLGLYLVKNIVETAKGHIWFESKEGKGTTFYFSIPFF